MQVHSAAGVMLAGHQLVPAGAGTIVRSQTHRAQLERAALAAFTTERPGRSLIESELVIAE